MSFEEQSFTSPAAQFVPVSQRVPVSLKAWSAPHEAGIVLSVDLPTLTPVPVMQQTLPAAQPALSPHSHVEPPSAVPTQLKPFAVPNVAHAVSPEVAVPFA